MVDIYRESPATPHKESVMRMFSFHKINMEVTSGTMLVFYPWVLSHKNGHSFDIRRYKS